MNAPSDSASTPDTADVAGRQSALAEHEREPERPLPEAPEIGVLNERLQHWSARAIARLSTDALAPALSLTLAAALAATWLLAVFPETRPLRFVAWTTLALTAMTPVAAAAWQGWRRFGTPQATALFLENALPDYRTDLRTLLQWADTPAPNPEAGQLRRHLHDRVIAQLADDERPALHLPRWPLRPWVRMAAGVVGLSVVAFWLAPEAMRLGASRLWFGYPAPLMAAVIDGPQAPLVSTVDLEYHFPAYTSRLPMVVSNTTGRVETMAGTDVYWTAIALQPVISGKLVISQGEINTEIPLEVISGRILRTQFLVTGAGAYEVVLQTSEGEQTDPVERRIAIEADKPPEIELLRPASNIDVMPGDVVDLEYVATDDYGLTGVSLVWYFAGDDENVRTLPLQGMSAGMRVQETVPFDLAPLRLQPRDEVVVFIEATDNDAVSGAHTSRSRPISLQVASPEDDHAELLEMKNALFEALLTGLGKHLEHGLNTWVAQGEGQSLVLKAQPASLDAAARVTALQAAHEARESWQVLTGSFDALLTAMTEDELTSERDLLMLRSAYELLYRHERDFHAALDRVLLDVQRGAVSEAGFVSVALPGAEFTSAIERTILQLEDLIAVHQADDVERTLEELADIRENLRELLEQYRNTNDPELREQIERELRRLETRMRELLERLASQVQELPYEHLNAEALEPSELGENVQEMTSSLDQVRQMLDSGDIESALQALDNLGQDLESMMNELGGTLEQQGPDGLSEFDQAMSELMDELNNLELAEQEIERQTQQMTEEMRRQRQEEIREQVQQELQSAQEQVRALQQEFAQNESDRLNEENQARLDDAEQNLQQLQQLLESGDVPGALEQASRLGTEFSDLGWQLRTEEGLRRRDEDARQQASSNRVDAESGDRLMERISESMEQLMQMGQPTPSPGQQQQMNELSQQQQQIGQQLERMRARMGEMAQRMPSLGEGLDEPLQQVGEAMGQSSQGLQQGQPQPAMQGQQRALQGLRQMRQQMQQMTQRERQRQQRQNGRNPDQERVEIPEEADGARRQYREDIQDAMREGALESYEDQIQRYYESLVR